MTHTYTFLKISFLGGGIDTKIFVDRKKLSYFGQCAFVFGAKKLSYFGQWSLTMTPSDTPPPLGFLIMSCIIKGVDVFCSGFFSLFFFLLFLAPSFPPAESFLGRKEFFFFQVRLSSRYFPLSSSCYPPACPPAGISTRQKMERKEKKNGGKSQWLTLSSISLPRKEIS